MTWSVSTATGGHRSITRNLAQNVCADVARLGNGRLEISRLAPSVLCRSRKSSELGVATPGLEIGVLSALLQSSGIAAGARIPSALSGIPKDAHRQGAAEKSGQKTGAIGGLSLSRSSRRCGLCTLSRLLTASGAKRVVWGHREKFSSRKSLRCFRRSLIISMRPYVGCLELSSWGGLKPRPKKHIGTLTQKPQRASRG